MALSPGTKLGAYEILGPLGAGGMGEVYRANHPRLGREVAVKILPAEHAANADLRSRFEQEARAASALNHPNIITIHDVGCEGSTYFLVMELVEGKTLRELLEGGQLPVRKTVEIGAQIAEGLAKAHESGIAHRDLKPENVMVSKDGLVKILDFGLAKLTPAALGRASQLPTDPNTAAGAVMGTVGYMSPEQASGGSVDFRGDQFSLGAVLYEMLAGRRAFERATSAQTLAAIIEDDPAEIARLNPKVPTALRWVLERCLEKDPANRYASTRDLARDLRNLRDRYSEISAQESIVGARPAALSWRGLRPAAWLLTGVLIGATLAVLLFRPAEPKPSVLRTLTFSGHDYAPTISADGRTVAFTSDRDGRRRIWLKQLAGSNEVALTSGPDDSPRFSPDGSMILFIRDEGGKRNLFRVPTVGGEVRKILEEVVEADWSPDGQLIAFLRVRNEQGVANSTIATVNADGEGEHVIRTVPRQILRYPRWSPDGRWIALVTTTFGVSEGNLRRIFLVRTDGSEVRTLDTPVVGGELSCVAWLDSQDEILYAIPESVAAAGFLLTNVPSSQVVRQNIQTGKAQTLFWMPTNPQTIGVLDTGRVLFDSYGGKENLREFELGGKQQPGIAERWNWLTQGNTTDRQPIYSPDGAWLAFTSNRSGNLDVWLMSMKDGAVRRVTDHPADDWDPAFTSDGRALLWTSRRTGHFEIWTSNLDGSQARQVTSDGVDAENATQTRDGRWIIYTSGNPEKRGVWKVHPDGTEAALLAAGTTGWPEASPDGQYALYTLQGGRSRVKVVRIEDSSLVPFEIVVKGGGPGRARWLPNGRAIAFTDVNEQGIAGVFVQDFVPGKDTSASRRPLAGFDSNSVAESFAFLPDGSRMALASVEQARTLMIAENVPGVRPPRRARR